MVLSKTLLTCLKYVIISAFFLSSNVCALAQLKKIAKVEKVKSFTNGSVALSKTTMDSIEVYSVTLPNNSKFHQPIVFFLGNKDEMIQNLRDLSAALEEENKDEVFEFTACGKDYQLSFSRTLGQKCFKIWEPLNTSTDFGRFYKATIDDILKFIEKH